MLVYIVTLTFYFFFASSLASAVWHEPVPLGDSSNDIAGHIVFQNIAYRPVTSSQMIRIVIPIAMSDTHNLDLLLLQIPHQQCLFL